MDEHLVNISEPCNARIEHRNLISDIIKNMVIFCVEIKDGKSNITKDYDKSNCLVFEDGHDKKCKAKNKYKEFTNTLCRIVTDKRKSYSHQ